MPNYQNGKIYSIRSHLTDDVYIGSTIETLANRLSGHKRYYKQWLNKKTNYTTSYKIIDKDPENCYIELVENYPCNNKNELCRREGEIIRNTTCVNKCIAGRTQKEWENDNKDKNKEHRKQYREENKEKISEKQKKYNEEHKETIAEYKKQYREIHKAEISEKEKQYRDNNKQQILEKANQKYTCECGGKYTKANKLLHKKTKKHQSFVNSN